MNLLEFGILLITRNLEFVHSYLLSMLGSIILFVGHAIARKLCYQLSL